MRWLILSGLLLAAGCVETTTSQPAPTSTKPPPPKISASQASQNFAAVVRQVEPIAERECRARTKGVNCDFRIVVDNRKNQPPNAFQTLEKNGRPVIVFTASLIRDTRNRDELAFVMGHEAAHHIQGHIARQRRNAVAGALILSTLASATGANDAGIRTAQDVGATVGARTYSKDFELEADSLGTVITARAGFNPVKGAAYFTRIPDPGNRFLGTHPPNNQRIETVRKTAARL
ncbi:M48 family metalloprotease [Parasulfitobacter algicola]|uniref:M48 family metalloprotease n=1 Tax=Parasulfitobacter algicola TaxID=2614809 RepID=A0ABX2IT15_9RHOB|nr:M48 family metalloprotease [Sulfitobacter algicola]NSX56054.1 M48 family metalloprotease [Sulfitobacter algicola]